MLALQRSAGNRAVASTLQRRTADSPAVQREESTPDWEHGLLTDLHQGGRVLGPAVRSAAARMPRLAATYTAGKTELENMLDFLKMHEDRSTGPSMGDRAVAAVAATGSVARKQPAAARKEMKAEIDAYNTKKPELRSAIGMITAQQAEVRSAAQNLTTEGQRKELQDKEREKAKAEAGLADVKQKRADAIEKMTMFLDFAGMLADPAKGWKSALDKATGMLGGTIKELVFADTMAGEIAAAQRKVDSLKQSVLGLEDAIKLSAIQSAAAKLEAEQTKLAAMLDGLVSTVYQAETAQQDLHQALTSLGGKGKAAAAALDEGSTVLDMGNDATRKLPAVRALLDDTDGAARGWAAQAEQYLGALEQGAGTLDANQRAWARDAVIAHRRQAEQWMTWAKTERSKLDFDEGFLAKGTFRERYTKGIEDALTGVRTKLVG
ncbi:MAG TPA: hypothetical protein VIC62_15610 [Nakamurella sp.]